MTATTMMPPASAKGLRWVRILLLIMGLLECYDKLTDLPVLFGNIDEIPGPTLAGRAILVEIVTMPLFSMATVVLAAISRVRGAIIALSLMTLVHFVLEQPATFSNPLELQGLAGLYFLFEEIVCPIAAIVALVLAWKMRRIVLAGVLASIKTIGGLAAVSAFTIGILIYGF